MVPRSWQTPLHALQRVRKHLQVKTGPSDADLAAACEQAQASLPQDNGVDWAVDEVCILAARSAVVSSAGPPGCGVTSMAGNAMQVSCGSSLIVFVCSP